jgi:hypothetical protein
MVVSLPYTPLYEGLLCNFSALVQVHARRHRENLMDFCSSSLTTVKEVAIPSLKRQL